MSRVCSCKFEFPVIFVAVGIFPIKRNRVCGDLGISQGEIGRHFFIRYQAEFSCSFGIDGEAADSNRTCKASLLGAKNEFDDSSAVNLSSPGTDKRLAAVQR